MSERFKTQLQVLWADISQHEKVCIIPPKIEIIYIYRGFR